MRKNPRKLTLYRKDILTITGPTPPLKEIFKKAESILPPFTIDISFYIKYDIKRHLRLFRTKSSGAELIVDLPEIYPDTDSRITLKKINVLTVEELWGEKVTYFSGQGK